MKVLVTGSEGFVGREVVCELKNKGHTPKGFDIATGQNLLNKDHIKKALKGVDGVIHLGAILENDNPSLWEVNVDGTKNLICEAVKAKVKSFIFLSSTGVYGFTKGRVSEKTDTYPQNLYEKSKIKAEQIVLKHQEEIEVKVLRSAMVFGPNKYWGRMIKVLGKGLPLPSKAKNTFQIIYVKELARALLLLLKKGDSGEIYLVSGKEKYSLKTFCGELKEVLGLPPKIKTLSPKWALILGKIFRIKIITKDNIRHLSKERNYNTEKIEKIGYKQRYTLKEAMVETVEEIKQMNLD